MRLSVPALLGLSLFLTGVGAAATAPYRGIVAIDVLGISRGTYGAVMTAGAIVGAIASIVLGWLADRLGDRRRLVLVTALFGVVGFGLIYALPLPLVFVAATGAILPFSAALFSQSFSYARAWYTDHEPARGDFAVSMLRTAFAAAWVIVPPVAGLIAAGTSPVAVFGVAAAAYVAVVLIFLWLIRLPQAATLPPPKRVKAAGETTRIAIDRIVGIGGVLMARIALFLHITILPLALTADIGGTLGQVGINASIAAAMEVPLMIGWAWAGRSMAKETIIAVACALFAVYLGLMGQATTVMQVYLLQGLNAVATAALLSIPISYMQETIKDRVGLSTSLMDALTVVAMLVSSALFGLMPAAQGYQPLFTVAAGVSLTGAVLMGAARGMQRRS